MPGFFLVGSCARCRRGTGSRGWQVHQRRQGCCGASQWCARRLSPKNHCRL